jgi:probable F420-dependent oxidoreductase
VITQDPVAKTTLSLTIAGLHRWFGPDPRVYVDVARAAEDAGVDQVVLADHVVMGARTDRYPYGEFPFPPDDPWIEPLTTLAAIAGATSRVRLGTGVLITPLRPPVLLAKTVATLDQLSGGRVDLGVGLGWQREEYEALGLPFTKRWARHDDLIRACRALWAGRGDPVSFDSPTVSFTDIWCEPPPAQARIPIWFGAKATEALGRRIAEQGDGWLPLGRMKAEDVVAESAVLKEAFVAAGRDPAELGIRVGLGVRPDDLSSLPAKVEPLVEVGVTSFSINVPPGSESVTAIADWLGRVVTAMPRQ